MSDTDPEGIRLHATIVGQARAVTDDPAGIPSVPRPLYEPRVVPPLTAPAVLCHDLRQVQDGEYWLHIQVIAEPATARPWPFPMRADLGRRIADMIRADLTANRLAAEGIA